MRVFIREKIRIQKTHDKRKEGQTKKIWVACSQKKLKKRRLKTNTLNAHTKYACVEKRESLTTLGRRKKEEANTFLFLRREERGSNNAQKKKERRSKHLSLSKSLPLSILQLLLFFLFTSAAAASSSAHRLNANGDNCVLVRHSLTSNSNANGQWSEYIY